MPDSSRTIIRDGLHTSEVLNVLGTEIGSAESLHAIVEKAAHILERSVDPIRGEGQQRSDGLLYGLIQSGKTSVITVTAAMAADNGFSCLVILTSDNNLLYEQTLERVTKALRGLRVLGKHDWDDPARFQRQVRTTPFAVVCSKNGNVLQSLLEAFRSAGARGLSAMIIDDEADQASLNTYTSQGEGQVSRINDVITQLREFFGVNTYLQVTATPQALFLQAPDHTYRPTFTILSHPGPDYVGGEVFFSEESRLLREVDLEEVDLLRSTHQPAANGTVPPGLKRALHIFLIGATVKVIEDPRGEFAFLCHVSLKTKDHEHIVSLIDRFKEDTINALADSSTAQYSRTVQELRSVYDDLAETHEGIADFDTVIAKLKFYLNGASIKLLNAVSNDEIKLDTVYNIFVGGNKLGRGVTIKNLIVSYYGRNPKKPNADTVLQHARMYGYRRKTLDVTRLFLPDKLAEHFRLIHQMENALRDIITRFPQGQFQGLYISSPLQATRRNVLDPTAIGMYVAGRSYNPSYPLRSEAVREHTAWLDDRLKDFGEEDRGKEVSINDVIALIERCPADPEHDTDLWNLDTLKATLEEIKSLFGNRAYLVVRRERDLRQPRRETQGILSGGEDDLAPADAPTLFIYRQNATPDGQEAVWWPQLRFADGSYVVAFSFER